MLAVICIYTIALTPRKYINRLRFQADCVAIWSEKKIQIKKEVVGMTRIELRSKYS